MKKQDAIARLKLFNLKCDQLLNSNFVKDLRKGQRGAILNWERGKGWNTVYIGPENESIEAFILTLRLFMQKDEGISLFRLSELYRILPVDENFKAKIERFNRELQTFLDSKTGLSIQEDGAQLSHKELFDFFVYGYLAHVDNQKSKTFTDFSGTAFFPIFQTHFVDTCIVYLGVIESISETNKKAIHELENG